MFYPIRIIKTMYVFIVTFQCVKVGHVVWVFNYTDKDKGINAESTFNITETEASGTTLTKFSMLENGTLIVKEKLNSSVPAYTVCFLNILHELLFF